MPWNQSLAVTAVLVCSKLVGGKADVPFYWNGNELFDECSKMSASCEAYLAVLADVASKGMGIAVPVATLCHPPNTNIMQLRDVVMKRAPI